MGSGYAAPMETIAGGCCNGPELLGSPLIAAEVGGGGAVTVIEAVARATSGFGLESVTVNVKEVVPAGAVVVLPVMRQGLVDTIQVTGSS